MRVMGVDVGFSKTRKTTGIAWLDGGNFGVSTAGTPWESRREVLPSGLRAEVIAIDGPLLRQDAQRPSRRWCESIFIRAPFSNRCKPGLSDFGNGLRLRNAARDAREQFKQFVTSPTRVGPHQPANYVHGILEAFPNAFLAVILPEKVFCSGSKPKPRKRFDWLYDIAIQNGALRSTIPEDVHLPDEVWHTIEIEKHHDKRAALICLLTAALAVSGKVHKVGDDKTGWFWLPSLSRWQKWAKEGLKEAENR